MQTRRSRTGKLIYIGLQKRTFTTCQNNCIFSANKIHLSFSSKIWNWILTLPWIYNGLSLFFVPKREKENLMFSIATPKVDFLLSETRIQWISNYSALFFICASYGSKCLIQHKKHNLKCSKSLLVLVISKIPLSLDINYGIFTDI